MGKRVYGGWALWPRSLQRPRGLVCITDVEVGILLANGEFDREELGDDEVLPEHLCGGTYKSRGGKKRKAKPKMTYKEQKERRIRKKFGTNGVALGADDQVKVKLEKGKKPAGKPRVAGSARGRELRAAAALARFEQVKTEEPEIKDEELVTDSEAESEEDEMVKSERDAVDIDGKRLLGRQGEGMVKVCEGEDGEEDHVKQEMSELRGLGHIPELPKTTEEPRHREAEDSSDAKPAVHAAANLSQRTQTISGVRVEKNEQSTSPRITSPPPEPYSSKPSTSDPSAEVLGDDSDDSTFTGLTCVVCTNVNDVCKITCVICAHVLQPSEDLDSWRCECADSQNTGYINSGDAGRCGLCWNRRPQG